MTGPKGMDGIRLAPRPQPVSVTPPVPPPPAPTRPGTTVKAPYRAILLYSVIGSYLYLLAAPVLPRFTLPYLQRTEALAAPPTPAPVLASMPAAVATPAPIPGPNRLTLSSAGVNGEIHEGPTEATLDKGIWHVAGTSTPDKGSNTVLAAHRFMFLTGGDTFYNLDKVKVGDKLSLVWDGRAYAYEVYETKVVTSKAVDIQDPTAEPIITLFTCTPLWTSKDRLVVRGRLVAQ